MEKIDLHAKTTCFCFILVLVFDLLKLSIRNLSMRKGISSRLIDCKTSYMLFVRNMLVSKPGPRPA